MAKILAVVAFFVDMAERSVANRVLMTSSGSDAAINFLLLLLVTTVVISPCSIYGCVSKGMKKEALR